MPVRQSVTFEDPVNNTEAFYQLVEVRPRVIKHKLKVRPQVEGYEVSVGGGYTAPCQPGPLRADLYDEYRSEILSGRRSRPLFLDDYALDCGIVAKRHHRDRYMTPRPVTKAVTNYEVESKAVPPPRHYAVGDATINVSKRTVRTASPPPALLSSATPTIPVLAPIKHSGYGREHKTLKSSFSNQVDLVGKRSDKIFSGSKATLYNVSLADGLEFIRSMLKGGSGFTLAEAVQAAKSSDIDPYGRKALYHSTMGDGWVGPTENWREKVRKWEQEELSLLEEEQRKRRAAAFHEWEEKMGEAELMEFGRAERLKELQKEWAQAEVQFREEAMEAERARQARLNAKSVNIIEVDVGEEAKRIKEQKEAERKAALAKVEAERQAKEQEEQLRKENERKEREEAERKKIAEREAALKREAEERKRMEEEEQRKKKEEEERIAREKKEEEERIAREKKEEEERIKREEEERLQREREEAERLKREEEERIRKEEEERLRLEEEEKRREEEEVAKKFGMSGFGAFGADPFAVEDDEEEISEEVQDKKEDEKQPEEKPEDSTKQDSLDSSIQDATADASNTDEGVELIADEEEENYDYSHSSCQETIIEEEEPAADADASDDTALHGQDTLSMSAGDADDSTAVTADDLNEGEGTSWHETEASTTGATFQTESGQRTTVEDNLEESTMIIEEEETTIVKRRRKVNKDGTVTEEESIETIPGTGYSVTGDVPSIEIGDGDDDFSSSSYSKTTTSWGGAEGEEEEEGSSTTRRTTTTTTTVTEETETTRTLKQKASIDTHDHEIIIYNKDGVEITRVTHGDVIVGFDKVDEVVMVKNGLLTVSHEDGECLVKIVDGEKHGTDRTEVNVFEFDGEVIVRSLIEVDHKYLVPKKSERKLSIHDIETRDA